jgi:hypothetical protein
MHVDCTAEYVQQSINIGYVHLAFHFYLSSILLLFLFQVSPSILLPFPSSSRRGSLSRARHDMGQLVQVFS